MSSFPQCSPTHADLACALETADRLSRDCGTLKSVVSTILSTFAAAKSTRAAALADLAAQCQMMEDLSCEYALISTPDLYSDAVRVKVEVDASGALLVD